MTARSVSRVLTSIVLVALGGLGGGGAVQASGSGVARCLWPLGGVRPMGAMAPIPGRAWCVPRTPAPMHPAPAPNSQSGGGQFTTIDDPLGVYGTFALGLNDRGDIVGGYYDSTGVHHGFLLRHGAYTSIDVPNSVQGSTDVLDINAQGDIVGNYTDRNGIEHGFLLRQGTYTSFDDPLAASGPNGGTAAWRINARGDILGVYADSTGTLHGFLLRRG